MINRDDYNWFGIRPEIRALCERGNITLDEYNNLSLDGYERAKVYKYLTKEALVSVVKYNLGNCFPMRYTYEHALVNILVPELLKHLEKE